MSTSEFTFQSDVAPPVPIHRFTVAQYHALGEQGVLGPEDRVELLEGLIVQKMNQLPPHSFAVQLLSRWMYGNVPESLVVRCQLPITLSASEPEPDFAIVAGASDEYRQRHPSGDECRLLVEVADTSQHETWVRQPFMPRPTLKSIGLSKSKRSLCFECRCLMRERTEKL